VDQPANPEPNDANTGHPGAKRWRPPRELGGFEKARPRIASRTETLSHEIQRYCVANLRLRVELLRRLLS